MTANEPPASPAAAETAGQPATPRRRSRRRLLRNALTLALLGLLLWAGIYVSSRGFSRRWRSALQTELRRRGLDISVRRVTLDPFEGLVAENVRLHRLNDRHTHLLTIRRAALDVNLKRLLQRRPDFLRSIDLRDTRLDLPLDPADPDSPKVRLRQLRAKIYFLPDRVQLAQLEGEWSDIHFSAAGEVLHPELIEKAVAAAPPETPPPTPEERERRRERGRQLLLDLRRLHFEGEPPRIAFHFNADLSRPLTEARASADLRTAAVRLRPGGYSFKSARARVDYEAGALRLRDGELTDARGQLQGQGEFRPADGEVQLALDGGCDLLAIWRHFQTVAAGGKDDPLADLVLKDPPRLRVDGRWRLPKKPAPAAAVVQTTAVSTLPAAEAPGLQLTGRFGLGRAEFRGVSVERFDTEFSWRDGQWFLRDARIASAPAAPGGPAQTLGADVLCADGQFRARVSGALGPAALAPLLPARAHNALGEWQFHDSPRVEINAVAPLLPGGAGAGEVDWSRLRADGRLTLGRTHFRGVPFKKLTSDFSAASGALTYRNLRLEREEGSATADGFVYDFNKHETRIENLRATLFPAEVAVWIDPDLVKQLKPYRFPKPPAATVNGVVQFDGGMASRLTVDFSAPAGMSYTFVRRELNFANLSGHVVFTDPRLYLENLRGELFGGEVRGGLELALGRGVAPDYQANLEMRDVDFTRLTKLYFDYDESRGKLSGNLRWNGRGEDPATMRGAGAVRVDGGNVFAIPVFGPLSPVLDTALPGVGKNVARLATADFLVTGGKIYNGNLNVKGAGFSMLGGGWLGMVDDTMSFRLRINAQGVFGAVLYPVSKLFEYSSAGPLHKPVWRPRVLAAAETPDPPAAEPVKPVKAKPVRAR